MPAVETPGFEPRNPGDYPFPLDGSVFTQDQYLSALSGSNTEWYRYYDLHLRYFTSLYKVEGNEDIERIWPILMRQAIEFGKVALVKAKGMYIPMSVVDVKFTLDYKVKSLEGIPARVGYGLNKDQKKYKAKAEDVALVKHNFNALPFVFYWQKVITDIIKLKDAAMTGSIASIKKFKRNVMNNSSTIATMEMNSMINPKSAVVDVIAMPSSYADEVENGAVGNRKANDISQSTIPNSITFEGTTDNASGLFGNLKDYMEFEYFQLGRRINTNKKAARNVAGEIDTETINFDILDEDFKNYLELFIRDINDKFDTSVRLISVIDDNMDSTKGVNDAEQNNNQAKKV